MLLATKTAVTKNGREQSLSDMILAISRVGAKSGDPAVPVRDLAKASSRVGEETQQQLKWAIAFAYRDVRDMSVGDRLNELIEFSCFIHPNYSDLWSETKITELLPLSGPMFASSRDVSRSRKEFKSLLQSFTSEYDPGLTFGPIHVMIDLNRIPSARIRFTAKGAVPSAMLRFARMLEEHGAAVRRCRYCERAFQGPKNKEYCDSRGKGKCQDDWYNKNSPKRKARKKK
jgi:hypothetical protein